MNGQGRRRRRAKREALRSDYEFEGKKKGALGSDYALEKALGSDYELHEKEEKKALGSDYEPEKALGSDYEFEE